MSVLDVFKPTFFLHRKFVGLSNEATALYIMGGAWSWSQSIRPGFIARRELMAFGRDASARRIALAIDELVGAGTPPHEHGLLVPSDDGFSVHDWTCEDCSFFALPPDRGSRCAGSWLRRAVLDRDGLTCKLCGESVRPDDVHIDHIVPWSRGGATVLENLRVTHARCNRVRGAGEAAAT